MGATSLLAALLLAAPAVAGDSAGRLITSRASGFVLDARGKLPSALIRCGVASSPAGMPLAVHLPRAHAASFGAVLEGTLGWTEDVFEQQRITLEARAGHDCYTHHSSDAEVVRAVLAYPGAVGIVSDTTPLSADVVILWPPQPAAPPPAPEAAPPVTPPADAPPAGTK